MISLQGYNTHARAAPLRLSRPVAGEEMPPFLSSISGELKCHGKQREAERGARGDGQTMEGEKTRRRRDPWSSA